MAIEEFTGSYYFLSNYFSCDFEIEGKTFTSTEHAFHYFKTFDEEEREQIRLAPTPGHSKKRGRKCTLRKDWEEVKDEIMEKVCRAKFDQNPKLKDKLLRTAPSNLIEGNTWGDKYWGKVKGQGKNRLGQILMKLRDEHSQA